MCGTFSAALAVDTTVTKPVSSKGVHLWSEQRRHSEEYRCTAYAQKMKFRATAMILKVSNVCFREKFHWKLFRFEAVVLRFKVISKCK